MRNNKVTTNYPQLPHNIDPSLPVPDEHKNEPLQPLGNVQARYEAYIEGCVEYYNKRGQDGNLCYVVENDRLAMIRRQPRSMRNYTKLGYTKIRAPDHVFQLLKSFWDRNRNNTKMEDLPAGNIYLNHWDAPTYMVSVENETLDGGGHALRQHVWHAARDTMEVWTGQKQAECSLYGIRVYTNGSMLAPHVDRNPLVASAIINIDQDVDEPW